MTRVRYNLASVIEFVRNNSSCKVLEKEYINNTTYMKFKCGCGKNFKTTFKQFKTMGKRQCNECGRKGTNKDTRFNIEIVKEYVEKYGVKLIDKEYINCKSPLKFLCVCGNQFEATFDSVKHGNRVKCFGCIPKDGNIFKKGIKAYNVKNHKDYINQIQLKYGDEYEILSEYVDAKTKLLVKHECGNIYSSSPDNLLNKERGCPKCKSSKGEKYISNWLSSNVIEYKPQYAFNDCIHKRPLPFDFAVFHKNKLLALIEYDGEQHFNPVNHFGGKKGFEKVKKHDKIKATYCKSNNIPLIRIPYYDGVDDKEGMMDYLLNMHLQHIFMKSDDDEQQVI